jgi:TusA-related sulfurtransferase
MPQSNDKANQPEKFNIDTSGLRCPLVIMRVQSQWVKNNKPMEFEVVSDDSDAAADLTAFAKRNKMRVIQDGNLFRFKPL